MKTNLIFTFIFLLTTHLSFSQWTQLGGDIDGELADDESGNSVSLSADGSRIAIGAHLNDGNGNDSGHVRIYENQGGNWVQLGPDIDGEAADDESGYSVSLSSDGNRVAIGAYLNDGNGNLSGHVRIYELQGAHWVQLGTDIDGEAADDRSGRSVSLNDDGSRVAIGAAGNDDNGNISGHVRIYEWQGGSWVQLGADIDGEAAGDGSGRSVSLNDDGSRVAIGATGNDGNGPQSGHVRIYQWDGMNWNQLGADIDSEAAADLSGSSVDLNNDGNRVAIGANANDDNGNGSGHVRIYEYDDIGMNWNQLGSDIDGEAAIDLSGFSVSLSADGNRVAIGAYLNDGNGVDSGHVRIYENQGGNWVQLGVDIDGEATEDRSGWSVSLSADGSIVAIGAYLNDGNGFDSGHVRVFYNPELQNNQFIGNESGENNTIGNYNTFLGDYSGHNNTEGSNNTYTGYQSGYSNTTGSHNVAIGSEALFNNVSGSNNTAIGYNADVGMSLTNATAIGNEATTLSSNQVTIGNSSVTRIGGYTNWFNFSDGRFKKNIQEDIPGLEFIEQLRPVSYEMDHPRLQAFLGEKQTTTSSQSSRRYVGFIAQEITQIVDENRYTFSGVERPQNEKDHYGIKYAEFVVPLTKAVQELSIENKELRQEIEMLKVMVYGDNGTSSSTSATGLRETTVLPTGFVLEQNIPNPFDKTTTIIAELPETVGEAKIVIYSLNGIELQSYLLQERGRTSVEIKGGSLQSGMYLYALLADGQLIDTKKMILTK